MDTICVRKGNVILDVALEDKEKYLSMGYVVIDEKTGDVLEESLTNDPEQLASMVISLKAENEVLKKEIAALKTKKSNSKKEAN